MQMRWILAAVLAACLGPAAVADVKEFRFESIDGGTIGFADWPGRPVLVVNTASLCAFTHQYEGLQALHETYRDAGLVVLAVPSNDFRQELGSDAEVRDFCDLTFGLDLPMSVITHVRGAEAHPFYRWLEQEHGIVPAWNFHKVLIGADGAVMRSWTPAIRPDSRAITGTLERALGS
jgi:glutathione peroxidase